MNGFDRQNCFIKNYYNNLWDSYAIGAAQIGNFNTFQTERMGLANAGHFAVVDNASPLSVPELPMTSVHVYPNPTTDFIFTEVPADQNAQYTYEVFDAAGRIVTSFSNAESRNQIDFSTYELGSYTIRITNLATNEVVVKPIIKS